MLFELIEKVINQPKAKPPKVLLFVPYGSWWVHNQVDAVLGCALQLRGVPVSVALCDGLYHRPDKKCYAVHTSPDPNACKICTEKGQQLFGAFKLPTLNLRSFINPADAEKLYEEFKAYSLKDLLAFQIGEFKAGEKMCGVVCSYHKITLRSFYQPDVLDTLRRFISYAVNTYLGMQKLFESFDPSHLLLWNGSGYAHSAALAAATSRGIKTITHERGLFDSSFIFSSEGVAADSNAYMKFFKVWEEIPLTTAEACRVRDYYLDREQGKNTNFHSYYKFSTEDSKIRSVLGIPPGAKVISVYTSSEWEVIYQPEHFEKLLNQMSYIDTLLDIFANDPSFKDCYLVIRHHPSIGFGPSGLTRQLDLIDKAYQQMRRAPSNVRIIMPDEKLTSYALLWNSSACLAFGSTIRHEALARAIPSASVESLFLSQGVPHQLIDSSTEGVKQLLQGMLAHADNFTVDGLRRLYRFTNSSYFRHSTTFKSFGIKNTHEPEIRISSAEDLLPGKDPALDRICDHVVSGRSILPLPTSEDWARTTSDEDQFLADQLAKLNNYREGVAAEAAKRAGEQLGQPRVKIFELAFGPDSQTPEKVSSFSRQIYPNLELSRVNLSTGGSVEDLLAQLRDLRGFEYCALTNAAFQYDERWLYQLVEGLKANPQLGCGLSAAWVANSGKTHAVIFSDQNSLSDFNLASRMLPQLSEMFYLLCFGCFRLSYLQEVLPQLLQLPNQNRSEFLFKLMTNRERATWHNLPMLRVDA